MSMRRPHGGYAVAPPRQLQTVEPTPYYTEGPDWPDAKFRDTDGGGWKGRHQAPAYYEPVPQPWVIAPNIGATHPGIAVFPSRESTKISFSPTVHLAFSRAWVPNIARFDELVLVDVDMKAAVTPESKPHWLVTFNGKMSGIKTAVLRMRCDADGDTLLGWAMWLPDTKDAINFLDFAPPTMRDSAFDSSTAVVCNTMMLNVDTYNEHLESVLDRQVNPTDRRTVASKAWGLFLHNLQRRSAETVEHINRIRMNVKMSHFPDDIHNAAFWQISPDDPPDA